MSYAASGMYDRIFNGIQSSYDGVCLPIDEQCVVARQGEHFPIDIDM